MLMMLASVGLPGTSGFVGEILVLVGAWNNSNWVAIFAATGLVLGATYIHYSLMPKSTYMLEHIDNADQARAWLGIYKEMKFNPNILMAAKQSGAANINKLVITI